MNGDLNKTNEKTNAPVRVLYLQKGGGLGGAARSLMLLLSSIQAHGVEPIVIVGADGWLTEQLTQAGISSSVISFPHWNLPSLIRNLVLAVRIARIVRTRALHLIHANEHWVGPLSRIAGWLSRRPVICHFRAGLNELRRYRPIKYLFPWYDAVVSVAEVLTGRLARFVPDDKLYTIRNPVIIPETIPNRQHPHRKIAVCIGSVGRLKGQLKVLQACIPWLKAAPNRFLFFAGYLDREPEYVDCMRSIIDSEGLSRQVRFLGPREDVPRLLAAADVLIAYSQIEGVPRVVMEAMAAGRPCIVSATPGMDEVIKHNRTGYLVDFDDNPHQVSRYLEILCNDTQLWSKISSEAARYARTHFSPEAHAHRIFTTYQRVLSSHPS